MPTSSFFSGVQRFAGQALGRAAKTYGQLDKSIGGILPGGSDNPLIGSSRPYFEKPKLLIDPKGYGSPGGKGSLPTVVSVPEEMYASQFEKDLGKAIDFTAGAIAGTRPFIQSAVKNSPQFGRDLLSRGLNQLPESANLFSRYYTGLGSEGLELPQSFISNTRNEIEASREKINVQKAAGFRDTLQSQFNQAKERGVSAQEYAFLNNTLAEQKSAVKRMQQGDVPIMTAFSAKSSNPLNSLGTSLGSAWFSPQPGGGYKSKETYDFVYADMDKKRPIPYGPYLGDPLTTSETFARRAAQRLTNSEKGLPASGVASPITEFGRAIVSKIKATPFDYEINIPSR
jgi:hypothetical protein